MNVFNIRTRACKSKKGKKKEIKEWFVCQIVYQGSGNSINEMDRICVKEQRIQYEINYVIQMSKSQNYKQDSVGPQKLSQPQEQSVEIHNSNVQQHKANVSSQPVSQQISSSKSSELPKQEINNGTSTNLAGSGLLQKNTEFPKEVEKEKEVSDNEEIPDKFYDSDLASVNEQDFLSDNEPPKDIVYERKLYHKQKYLHIYKTIIRVGKGIDKPAPFDQIVLRFKEQPITTKQGVQSARTVEFIQDAQFETYNLGKKYEEIERLVTSMKETEVAIFQVQELQVSKKTNIKVLKNKTVYVIQVQRWITVIDIDGNKDVLKYLLRRGQGPNRVSKYDEVTFIGSVKYAGVEVLSLNQKGLKIQQHTIDSMQPILWKILTTMKKNEKVKVVLNDDNMISMNAVWPKVDPTEEMKLSEKQENDSKLNQQTPDLSHYNNLMKTYGLKVEELGLQIIQSTENLWEIEIEVIDLISIDDIYMNGKVLKKLLIKGVSTSKPESSSFIYYALKFLDSNKNTLWADSCFNSDWWEDYGKLNELGCRKNYMDEYKMSKLLKASMKRMKPAEVSEIECRDMSLFQYGHDFEELKSLWPKEQHFPPNKIFIIIRVYNFTEGRNCFNMDIPQKVEESKRKKIPAIKLLTEGNYPKAFKKFQNIVSFFGSGDIDQTAYDEKISALMNSILCLMKQSKYSQMILLCNMILESPKHGFNQDKMRIKAQGIKVQGNTKNAQGEEIDSREAANLEQNRKILDKCLYRKALALLKTGQSKLAIESLNKIESQNEQVKTLRAEAEKHLQNYQQKSKKLFQNMFGS